MKACYSSDLCTCVILHYPYVRTTCTSCNVVDTTGFSLSASVQVRVGGFRLPKELGIGQFQELKPHEVRRVTDAGAQSNPYL